MSAAGLPNPWVATLANSAQTGRLDQIFSWAHPRYPAFMDRHAVISFSSQRFNSQLLKASHSFQRVSPGEEEKEVAEESIFHHKADTGEAVPGLMPLENVSLTVRQSRAISNRQPQSCCRALGSPQWAQADWDTSAPGTLEPAFAREVKCSNKGYGANLPLHPWEHPSTLVLKGWGLPTATPHP